MWGSLKRMATAVGRADKDDSWEEEERDDDDQDDDGFDRRDHEDEDGDSDEMDGWSGRGDQACPPSSSRPPPSGRRRSRPPSFLLPEGAEGERGHDRRDLVWRNGRVTRVEKDDFFVVDSDLFCPISRAATADDGAALSFEVGDEVEYQVRRRRDHNAAEPEGCGEGGGAVGVQVGVRQQDEDSSAGVVVRVRRPESEHQAVARDEGNGGDQVWPDGESGWQQQQQDEFLTNMVSNNACNSTSQQTGVSLMRARVEQVTLEGVRLASLEPTADLSSPCLDCPWERWNIFHNPWKGDLVVIRLTEDESGVGVASVEPLRELHGSGRVEAWNEREGTGVVDGFVFLSSDACPPSYRRPRHDDLLVFTATECDPTTYNDHCLWRAISVIPRRGLVSPAAAGAAPFPAVVGPSPDSCFVPGVAAAKARRRSSKPSSFCRQRLKAYELPHVLKRWQQQSGGPAGADDLLLTVCPVLARPLSPSNYFAKFSACLFLEEMTMEQDLRRYDLCGAAFRRRGGGGGLALEIQGLMEKRPSLVAGDSVLATRDGRNVFEGIIESVHSSWVLLHFESGFQSSYCGEAYDVSFRLNRTPFRRLHRAAEEAVSTLGTDVLFPNCAHVGPPQINLAAEEAAARRRRRRSLRGGGEMALVREISVVPVAPLDGGHWVSPVLPLGLWINKIPPQGGGEEGGCNSTAPSSSVPTSAAPPPPPPLHLFDLGPSSSGLFRPQPYFDERSAVLLGGKTLLSPRTADSLVWFNGRLNREQRLAVKRILQGESRPTPYIIYGPPGTGKTVTLVEAILQVFFLLRHSRILVTAPSNSAADLIVERLARAAQEREEEGSSSPAAAVRLRSELARLNAFSRGRDSAPEGIAPFCHTCDDDEQLGKVARFRILVTTCSTSGSLYRLGGGGGDGGRYTHCFIDEAGYLSEPEALLPIGLLGRLVGRRRHPGPPQIVLAGDPMQLGPVLQSREAKAAGLEQSLLERLAKRRPYTRDPERFTDHGGYDPLLVTRLVRSYRSHEAIISWPSSQFYHGDLRARKDSRKKRKKDALSPSSFRTLSFLPRRPDFPVVFHGVRGCQLQEDDSPSWFNPVEVHQVVLYAQRLCREMLAAASEKADDEVWSWLEREVGIITPYRKQVEKFRQQLDAFELPRFKVGSVEEFQGQERGVILVSTVRSSSCSSSSSSPSAAGRAFNHLGFLDCPKRTNVALTRARDLLIVVGDPVVLCADPVWASFVQYCRVNKCCRGSCEEEETSSLDHGGFPRTMGQEV